jgi:glycosyltransferase involved in cell wall biosynthesis
VTTFHGTYNFKNKFKKFYNSVMLKSKLIIAGSNFIFNHINDNYERYLNNKNKLLVIFRGINLNYYDPRIISDIKLLKLKKEWSIEDDSFKILLPGRLTNWKGQLNFIEALNILIEDYKKDKFQAIILGSDQGRNVYKKKLLSLIARYNINKKIKFVEHCNEMPLAYALADIVVSTSIEPEAFGRVAVEAQAMQKPIIATKLGGSMETIVNNKTGILYKFDDPRELAKNINSFMETDKLALNIMGVEGRKNVVKKFDVEKMCQSTFNEYKKLLNL